MADENKNTGLTGVARTIGSAVGKVVSTVGGGSGEQAAETPAPKANLWNAEYAGSGTFIIHKPKRKAGKRHQTVVRNRRRGMRK